MLLAVEHYRLLKIDQCFSARQHETPLTFDREWIARGRRAKNLTVL